MIAHLLESYIHCRILLTFYHYSLLYRLNVIKDKQMKFDFRVGLIFNITDQNFSSHCPDKFCDLFEPLVCINVPGPGVKNDNIEWRNLALKCTFSQLDVE